MPVLTRPLSCARPFSPALTLAALWLFAAQPAAHAQSTTYTFTTLNPLASAKTGAEGINATGQVVGFYLDPGTTNTYGYVTGAGSTNPSKSDPFGSTSTSAYGINNVGQVVGEYKDPISGNTYGYVTGAGGTNPVTLDPFGSVNTDAYGINATGQIVGRYLDPASGRTYGYLATPNAAPEPTAPAAFGLGALCLTALSLRARKRQTPI